MLEVYLVSMALGGIFVLLSAIGGGHDADADADVDMDVDADLDMDLDADVDMDIDADVDMDVDADVDLDADADADLSHDMDGGGLVQLKGEGKVARRKRLWLPIYSFKFWTFSSTFFGMTGTALTWLTNTSATLTFPLSLGVGLGTGTGIAYALQKLKENSPDSTPQLPQLVGTSARVILPIEAQQKGKIEVVQNTRTVVLVAQCDDTEPINKGEEVIIVAIEGELAQVVRASQLIG